MIDAPHTGAMVSYGSTAGASGSAGPEPRLTRGRRPRFGAPGLLPATPVATPSVRPIFGPAAGLRLVFFCLAARFKGKHLRRPADDVGVPV